MPNANAAKSLRSIPTWQRRAPAVPVLVAVSFGIVADWYLPLDAMTWTILAVTAALAWVAAYRLSMSRVSAVLVLTACGLFGAAVHHWRWSVVSASDLLCVATDQPRPVRFRAIIESPPVVMAPKPVRIKTDRPIPDRTVADVRAMALIDGQGQVVTRLAGRVRIDVLGHLPQLSRGTEVEIFGLLQRPSIARNPGAFDFRKFLRERGVHTIVRCEFPAAIQVLSEAPRRWLPDVATWQGTLAGRLKERLSSQNGALAVALLLGPRTDISLDLKDAFLQSGTVHFLAISGINVAILVAFLWPLVRMTRLPRKLRLLTIALCVLGYVALTDSDPPVLRATILVLMMLVSLFSGRISTPINQLAVAGLVILALNPHDLFQAGAQLSFLAILALHWLLVVRQNLLERVVDPLDEISQTWWETQWSKVRDWTREAFLTTFAVWIFTLPLVLARFHLVSPIGFVVNVVLSLWMSLTLLMGYVCLLLAIVCPPLLELTAPVLDGMLWVFAWVVQRAAEVPWGHFKIPGPNDLWLASFYVLILTAGSGLLTSGTQRWCWRGIAVWCLGGLAVASLPESRPGLRCTFLSVGHGAAVLIELPNRQTILYDAGSLENENRARQVVESALIACGKTRLDAIVISHADVDHFNAVPGLIENFPVDRLFVSPTFLDFKQFSVTTVCETAIKAGVPVKLVWSDDRLIAAKGVELRILQPPATGFGRDDNANSIVLSIRYAGRSLLLTGDLEHAGLQALLQTKPEPHDILLAPHHGSMKANPPDLARWAAPRWVVVSGGTEAIVDKLREPYGDGVDLLSTSQQGAITIDINLQGEVSASTQLAITSAPAPFE